MMQPANPSGYLSRIPDPDIKRRVRQIARANRRARLAGAVGKLRFREWRRLCDRLGGKCLACGQPGPLSIDHVVPLVFGGPNLITNVQPLCVPCNNRKGQTVADYRPTDNRPQPWPWSTA